MISSPCQDLQNGPLRIVQVTAHGVRSQVVTRQEAGTHVAAFFEELRLRVPSIDTKLDNSLSTSPPPLHEPPSKKHLGETGVSRVGPMVALEVADNKARGQGSAAPDLEPVIENCDVDGPTWVGIVTVADGVHKSFAQRFDRKQGLVDSLEETRLDSTSDGKVPPEKQHGFLKQPKAIAVNLLIVEEFRLVETPESSHLEQTLRKSAA